jgi:hypothetical protein
MYVYFATNWELTLPIKIAKPMELYCDVLFLSSAFEGMPDLLLLHAIVSVAPHAAIRRGFRSSSFRTWYKKH